MCVCAYYITEHGVFRNPVDITLFMYAILHYMILWWGLQIGSFYVCLANLKLDVYSLQR